jgi:hypothetical protein
MSFQESVQSKETKGPSLPLACPLVRLSSSPAENRVSAAVSLDTRTASIALDHMDYSPAISTCKPHSNILPTWLKVLHGTVELA